MIRRLPVAAIFSALLENQSHFHVKKYLFIS